MTDALKAAMRGKLDLPADALVRLTDGVRRLRDAQAEVAMREELLADAKKKLTAIEFDELPTLFEAHGCRAITLEAEGNHPAFEAKANPYYRASLPRTDSEKREKAYAWLEENGHGDLIKREFVISFAVDEGMAAKKLEEMLVEAGFDYEQDLSVHASTLTAFVREMIEKKHEDIPLETLGAMVGKRVQIKPVKEK